MLGMYVYIYRNIIFIYVLIYICIYIYIYKLPCSVPSTYQVRYLLPVPFGSFLPLKNRPPKIEAPSQREKAISATQRWQILGPRLGVNGFSNLHMGVSKNRGTPNWMVKIMEITINPWMIWG